MQEKQVAPRSIDRSEQPEEEKPQDLFDVIITSLADVKAGIEDVKCSIDKMHETVKEFFDHLKEKGLIWRSR